MALKLSQESHGLIIDLNKKIQDRHTQNSEFRDKLEAIDEQYATQKYEVQDTNDCTVTIDGIKVPLVGSEIDTITAQLASTFIAHSPIFPVLATKDNWSEALTLQSIIDRDARYQGWARQLLLFITRSVRYNVAALQADQAIVRSPVITESRRVSETLPEVSYEDHTMTSLRSTDMYNTFFDPRVTPADIPMRGEYAGFNEIVTRSELKSLGSALSRAEQAYNLDKAYKSVLNQKDTYYFYPPDISEYTSARESDFDVNWMDWLGMLRTREREALLQEDTYLLTTLYARVIPAEFKLGSGRNPEVWKFLIINNEQVIHFKQMITPFSVLPMLFSDIREDGLFWQTKSPAENMLPYEEVATELLNTRLNGSRRALSDRAIFDPNYIDANQVNSIVPAAKIPLKSDLRNLGDGATKRMNEIYYPIPFEGQGVVNSLTDLNTVMAIKDQVNGQNFTSRGERQKGNRTRFETDLIATRTEEKSMPYAIRLEEQVFSPLKLIIKTYILLSQTIPKSQSSIIDPYTEETRTINLAAMRSKMIDFRITDGLYNKQAFSDPEVLITLLQTLSTSQQFTMEYDIGKVLADFLHVFNIDVNKYRRMGPNGPQPGTPQLGPGVSQAAPPGAVAQSANAATGAVSAQPAGNAVSAQEPVSP